MAIQFACSCGTKIEVPDDLAGRRGKCPKCKAIVTVPSVEKTGKPTAGVNMVSTHANKRSKQSAPQKTTTKSSEAGAVAGREDNSVLHMQCECGNYITIDKNCKGRETKCNKCGRILKVTMQKQEKGPTVPEQTNKSGLQLPSISINTSPPPLPTKRKEISIGRVDEHKTTTNRIVPPPIPTQSQKPKSPDLCQQAESPPTKQIPPIPISEPPSDRPTKPSSEPVLIPVSVGEESSVQSVTPTSSSKFETSLDTLAKRGVPILLEPGSTYLQNIRLYLALGLIGIVCLIQFVSTMRWELSLTVFSIILLIAGIATIIVGGLARSPRDIILGCITVVATFSTPLFIRTLGIYRSGFSMPSHRSRMLNTILKALVGWAGVAYVLLTGFAALAIIPPLIAMRKKSQSIDAKKTENVGVSSEVHN